jgi:hypothetical protein
MALHCLATVTLPMTIDTAKPALHSPGRLSGAAARPFQDGGIMVDELTGSSEEGHSRRSVTCLGIC